MSPKSAVSSQVDRIFKITLLWDHISQRKNDHLQASGLEMVVRHHWKAGCSVSGEGLRNLVFRRLIHVYPVQIELEQVE